MSTPQKITPDEKVINTKQLHGLLIGIIKIHFDQRTTRLNNLFNPETMLMFLLHTAVKLGE